MIQIYRIVDKTGGSFLYEEVCRNCAEKKQKEGFEIEFDKHLYKFIEVVDEVSFYEDGSDEENPEINCSICESYLVSQMEEPL